MIHQIHRGTLQPWIEARLKEGRAPGTINHGIKLVNRILNLAADEWVNEFTWLDLKHTFGRRLRAAGVCFEDRQDLLGHRSYRMTTHYSAPELGHLIEAANQVCANGSSQPELAVLKRPGIQERSRKTPAKSEVENA